MAVLRVRESFAADTRVYSAGEIVDAADPIVAGREALFAEVTPTKRDAPVAPVVEQATAAPGEKRNTPAKAVAKKAR